MANPKISVQLVTGGQYERPSCAYHLRFYPTTFTQSTHTGCCSLKCCRAPGSVSSISALLPHHIKYIYCFLVCVCEQIILFCFAAHGITLFRDKTILPHAVDLPQCGQNSFKLQKRALTYCLLLCFTLWVLLKSC